MRLFVCLICLSFFLLSCSKINELIPLDVDKLMGAQFAKQMTYDPAEGKILDRSVNPELYHYLEKIKKNILKSGKVKYKNDFLWELHVIKNDSVLNAFCVSGGYIYVYTGLIKFLDNEAELAGILAHEIAHADNRHSTIRMVWQYGVSAIIGIATGGDAGLLVEIGRQLMGLTFSRSDEKQADECAVTYLYTTDYDARAVSGFFKKLVAQKRDSYMPEFLSTHPASEARVQDIEAQWKMLGAKPGKWFAKEYEVAKKLL